MQHISVLCTSRNMSAPTAPTYRHADPYKERNVDNTSLSDKVVALTTFIQTHKYGMLTTRNANSGMLMSRCMALAGTVGPPSSTSSLPIAAKSRNMRNRNRKIWLTNACNVLTKAPRRRTVQTSSSTPTPTQARCPTSPPIPT